MCYKTIKKTETRKDYFGRVLFFDIFSPKQCLKRNRISQRPKEQFCSYSFERWGVTVIEHLFKFLGVVPNRIYIRKLFCPTLDQGIWEYIVFRWSDGGWPLMERLRVFFSSVTATWRSHDRMIALKYFIDMIIFFSDVIVTSIMFCFFL